MSYQRAPLLDWDTECKGCLKADSFSSDSELSCSINHPSATNGLKQNFSASSAVLLTDSSSSTFECVQKRCHDNTENETSLLSSGKRKCDSPCDEEACYTALVAKKTDEKISNMMKACNDIDNYSEDRYSDISETSEDTEQFVNWTQSMKAFADGDDSQSDCDDNYSIASNSSLTPSLVGEALSGIILADRAPTLAANNGLQDGAGDSLVGKSSVFNTFVPSLFPHVPPTINFCLNTQQNERLPETAQRLLKWKLSPITPQLVRQTITNSGFQLVKQSPNWIGTWGKHMKAECFKSVCDFQKVNHFPGTFHIGRKDKLWRNISAMQIKFSKNEFGFVPRTYVLPTDLRALKLAWKRDNGKRKWIIKPPASARGAGIKVIQHWNEIPKRRQLIVQRYVSRPYLIDSRKFDLRIYVYVSSFSPLRVYIYEDGLVRFASMKYTNNTEPDANGDGCHGNSNQQFVHLTNYSINKHSDTYEQNENADLCQGHKWTLKAFWSYMQSNGVDTDVIWRRIVDIIVKTLISGEAHVSALIRQHVISQYTCHELFGFDILLDERLRPWLLEVNISPSLHSTAQVDLCVKAPLLRDLFNIAGYHLPNKLSAETVSNLRASLSPAQQLHCAHRLCIDKRLYTSVHSAQSRAKQQLFIQMSRYEYLDKILDDLTPDDIRYLIRAEDELSRGGGFIRVFPSMVSHLYAQYYEKPHYYNMLYDAWETRYCHQRHVGRELLRQHCANMRHLDVPKNYLRRKTFSADVVARAESMLRASTQPSQQKSCADPARATCSNHRQVPAEEYSETTDSGVCSNGS